MAEVEFSDVYGNRWMLAPHELDELDQSKYRTHPDFGVDRTNGIDL